MSRKIDLKIKVFRTNIIIFIIISCITLIIPMNNILVHATNITEDIIESEIEKDDIVVTELDLGDYKSEMIVGEKQLLDITIIPTDATNKNIIFSSSDTSVASINSIGRITAINPGKTEISIMCEQVVEKFTLIVKKDSDEERINIKDIEIGNYNDELEVGKTLTLETLVIPANATNSTIEYISSDNNIASVNSQGEVKGISKGDVIIYVKAGDIIKEIPIKVKVLTTKISVNTTYVVMKPNETYQLVTSISPTNANQNISYRSTDKNVVSVSVDGKITSKSSGTASIIVSNDETSASVVVIVNETAKSELIEDKADSIYKLNEEYPAQVNCEEYEVITSDMLYYFYKTGKTLTVFGDGYTIKIDGKNIVNYNNEFNTYISFIDEVGGKSFILNNGENICGEIELEIDNDLINKGNLYLYNESKAKYENIKIDNINKITLDKEGKYLISTKKIYNNNINIIIIISGIISIITMLIIYILGKKRYWFW